MSKVYDGFLFFNELDLLEIRLNELDEVVDKFILVESILTHASKEKPYYFEANKNRFKKFLDKIIHIKVNDRPTIPASLGRGGIYHNRHEMEWFQRDCISRGFKSCDPNDIVMVSDVDEIPTVESIKECKNLLLKEKMVSFNQLLFYYKINGLCVNQNGYAENWAGTVACKHKDFTGAQNMRNIKGTNKTRIKNGGWHFSYLGGPDMIAQKIESYSHAEFDNDYIKDRKRIQERIDKGLDLFDRPGKPRQIYIDIKSSLNFPKYIQENIEKYNHLIK
jgi:beta-1,4-mannosyl-glycoprotein beta-1,4-N-acetylglucosaminyltransferase